MDVNPVRLMHQAVVNGDLEAADMVIQKQPGIINHLTIGKRSWMHLAAGSGQAVMIRWLHSKGLNVNAEDRVKILPLECAVIHGVSLVTAEVLLDCGADPNANQRNSYLSELATSPHGKLTAESTLALATLLVESGCKVDVMDSLGRTPLVHAVSNGRKDIAFMLLDNGASISCSNPEKDLFAYARSVGAGNLADEVKAYYYSKMARNAVDHSGNLALLRPL